MTVEGAVTGGHRAPAGSPPFPGGIGASHLRVYDSVAPDGQAGGTPHCHTACTEAYVVVAGSGRVRLGDEIKDVKQWDVVRVAPGVVRAFEAGPEGLELIAVGGPKPEGGDGVQSDEPWPDAS